MNLHYAASVVESGRTDIAGTAFQGVNVSVHLPEIPFVELRGYFGHASAVYTRNQILEHLVKEVRLAYEIPFA